MLVTHDQYSLTPEVLEQPNAPGEAFERRRKWDMATKGINGYVLRGDVVICPDGVKLHRDSPHPGVVRISRLVPKLENASVNWLRRVQ